MTGQELIKFCESKLGTNYVYGTKGTVMTTNQYNTLKKMYPVAVWDSDKSKINTVCVDCSGLIQWATGVKKNSTNLRNTTKKVYDISTVAQAPVGAILWKQGHVGVYAGDGWGIEAKGSAYGVVRTKVSSTKWEKWLLPDYIDYSEKPASSQEPAKPQQPAPPPAAPQEPAKPQETAKPQPPAQAAKPPSYKAGDNVTVSGIVYSNRNGGRSVRLNNTVMTVVNIYSSGKFPIAFAKKGNKTVYGYGDTSVIKGGN